MTSSSDNRYINRCKEHLPIILRYIHWNKLAEPQGGESHTSPSFLSSLQHEQVLTEQHNLLTAETFIFRCQLLSLVTKSPTTSLSEDCNRPPAMSFVDLVWRSCLLKQPILLAGFLTDAFCGEWNVRNILPFGLASQEASVPSFFADRFVYTEVGLVVPLHRWKDVFPASAHLCGPIFITKTKEREYMGASWRCFSNTRDCQRPFNDYRRDYVLSPFIL